MCNMCAHAGLLDEETETGGEEGHTHIHTHKHTHKHEEGIRSVGIVRQGDVDLNKINR
jgi:hypothetical protein